MKKRIGSLLMAVAIVLSMSTVAFAASKVTSIEKGVFVKDIGYTSGSKYDVGEAIDSITAKYSPGDTINIFLDPSKFAGAEFTPETGMSSRDLERAGVSFRMSGRKNSNVVDNVSFKEKQINGKQVALLQVKIASNIVATDTKEFEATITLYADKVKQQVFTIYGEIGTDVLTVSAGETYIYLGNGEVAEAEANVSNIEIDTGNDVSLFAKLYKGKKYYAVSRDTPTDADMELLEKHSELLSVYYLDTDGFIGSDVSVKIKTPEKLFVYDENGKAIGTTADRLPLSSKYFLADSEVNITGSADAGNSSDSDSDLVEPEDGDSDLPPVSGGNDSDIPDTGIGFAPKLAMFAVILGVGTVGGLAVTGRKRKN